VEDEDFRHLAHLPTREATTRVMVNAAKRAAADPVRRARALRIARIAIAEGLVRIEDLAPAGTESA
jgi:hypothetical protein